MRWSNRTWSIAVGVAALAVVGVLVLSVAARMFALQRFSPAPVDAAMAKAGERLFHHEWEAGDPLSPNGDGLGPVFNARSCVACHNQEGAGGGGSRDHDVTSFSVAIQGQKPRAGVLHAAATRTELTETLDDVHPDLPPLTHWQLSQCAAERRNPAGRVLDGRPVDEIDLRALLQGEKLIPMPAGVTVSQVNTPALFGDGWIDAVPDRILVGLENDQKRWWRAEPGQNELPVGRVSRLPDGRIGKFGWKAQTATLSDFVQAACANELGLGNPKQAQPASLKNPGYKPRGLDLTQEQCDQITAFVASLDRPRERSPAKLAERDDARAGRKLFSTIGCADCHVPDLGSIEGIYSDLLLHRMDPGMAGSGGYNNRPEPVPTADPNGSPDPSEWRTPPLWGVADSAPYMHDGRADTLEEAIALHGGQGQRAALHFGQKLTRGEQMQLIAFLKTLRAP
jgi:CxxC motif-containing protein (DUF1111 family)